MDPLDSSPPPHASHRLFPFLLGGGILVVAVGFVAFSLLRPQPDTFAPSPVLFPVEVKAPPTGSWQRTIDASHPDWWQYFSFRLGSLVADPGPLDWDLAFRRFQVIANGGEGFPGEAGVLDLGEVDFQDVDEVPTGGYLETRVRSDSIHPVLERWYDYSFFSHLLSPKPRVFAVRTARGYHLKLEFLGYYCPGARPGCITFRYEFLPPPP
ncbi:MAG: HmuY family protein [Gemmatimonadota bacterium]